MVEDLLAMVEESRTKEMVCGAIDATFITMIPKKRKREIFQDFRSISLCNLVYKLISKIIVNRIKHALSENMSKETFGFVR